MAASRKRIFIIILLTFFFLLLAGGLTFYLLYKSFKKPSLVYAHHILTFDKGLMEGNSTLALKNDNPWQIRIDSLTYSLQMNGKTYLAGGKKNPIVLRPHSIDTFVLPYIEAASQMNKYFENRDSAPATVFIKGYVSALAFKKIPLKLHHNFMYVPFKKPDVVGNHNYMTLDTGGIIRARTVFDLANKNKYPIRLDSFYYSLDVEGINYIRSHRLKPVKAGPLDTVEAALNFSFNSSQFQKNLGGRDSGRFQFVFSFELSGKGFDRANITIPVDKELPVFTYFKILSKHLKIRKVSGSELQLEANLEIYNPNTVTFKVNGSNYALSVDEKDWVKGDIKEHFMLPAKKSVNLTIPFAVSLKEVSHSAGKYLKEGKPLHYKLRVGYTLQANLPTMKEIKMNLQDTGVLHLHPFHLK